MEAHVQISQIIVIQITVELLYYYIVIVCMTSIILTKRLQHPMDQIKGQMHISQLREGIHVVFNS